MCCKGISFWSDAEKIVWMWNCCNRPQTAFFQVFYERNGRMHHVKNVPSDKHTCFYSATGMPIFADS